MARRAMRSSWGSVTRLDARRWRIRYWGKDASGAYRRMSETVRGSRRDADDRLAALRLDHSEDAPCPTVGECYRRWYLADRQRMVDEGDLSPQTMDNQGASWRLHVAPRWEDVPVDAVRPLDVQQWMLTMTRAQAHHARIVLSGVVGYAMRYGLVETNPLSIRYIMPSQSTVTPNDAGCWDVAGLERAWAKVRGAWAEPAFVLAAFGSCRVGESLGTRAEDVHAYEHSGVTCAIVEIRRQVRGDGSVSERLKTRQSRRVVVVPGEMGEALLDIAGRTEGWLSGDGLGGFVTQNRASAWWHKTMAGVDGLEYHPLSSLRKTWQTTARWTLRLPPWVTETLMGHASTSGGAVTAEHYDQPSAIQLADVVCEAYAANPYADGWAQKCSPTREG